MDSQSLDELALAIEQVLEHESKTFIEMAQILSLDPLKDLVVLLCKGQRKTRAICCRT